MTEFSYVNQNNTAYMVLPLQPDDQLDEMALGMLLNNAIPGLLPLSRRWEKQHDVLYYNISSLTPMARCGSLLGDERRLTRFLRGLCLLLNECQEYLLEESALLLSAEHIFVKAATGEPAVPYLPLLGSQPVASPKAFLDEVIRAAAQQLPQGSPLLNLLYREGYKKAFVPDELLAALNQLDSRAPAAPAQAPAPAPMPAPAPAHPPVIAPVAQPAPAPAAPMPAPTPAPAPASKPKGLGGLFGHGGKKAEQPAPADREPGKTSKKDKKDKKAEKPAGNLGFDSPFAPAGGKIEPRGPQPDVSAPAPAPAPAPASKPKGLGGLFGHGGKKAAQPAPAAAPAPAFDNPFAPAGGAAAPAQQPLQQPVPQPLQQPVQQPVQQAAPAYAQSRPAPGAGHTVNLASVSSGVPQGTMPMPTGGASGASGFPVMWLVRKGGGGRVQITHNNFHVGRKLDEDDIVDYAVLTATPYMGSDHCYFLCKNGQLYVVDNNSQNGTWVNGRQLAPAVETPVNSGDELRLADVFFVLQDR